MTPYPQRHEKWEHTVFGAIHIEQEILDCHGEPYWLCTKIIGGQRVFALNTKSFTKQIA